MNLYLHHGLDLWFEGVVKPHCRGKALLIRYADDFVCAFQYREDAEAFYRVLPKRLARFGLEVAPEKTRLLRFSRFHPGMRRRFAFLGFEFYWSVDRQGERRLRRRTARKKLGRAFPDAEHRVGMTVFSLTAEASISEEPGAVVPHAGICAGGAG